MTVKVTHSGAESTNMKKIIVFAYGMGCYLLFLGTFLYAIGFVGNLFVPKSIDSGVAGPFWLSLSINVALLGLFGVQHSAMARPGFKRWWTKIIPVPIERSTYVLCASLALIVLFWQWRPLPNVVWSVQSDVGRIALWSLCGLGWGLVLVSTFLISHAHLFGVSQVHAYFRRRQLSEPDFQTPSLYRYVRHPMQAGFLIAFWATPLMTGGRLVFALVTSAYILGALQLEERDLIRFFGKRYETYRERVPMLIPKFARGGVAKKPTHAAGNVK